MVGSRVTSDVGKDCHAVCTCVLVRILSFDPDWKVLELLQKAFSLHVNNIF